MLLEFEDKVIMAKFPNLHFLAFSTEPWTLTACKGLAVNPSISYVYVECNNGEQYVIATQRCDHYKAFFKKMGGMKSVKTVGEGLQSVVLENPLNGKPVKVCF